MKYSVKPLGEKYGTTKQRKRKEQESWIKRGRNSPEIGREEEGGRWSMVKTSSVTDLKKN